MLQRQCIISICFVGQLFGAADVAQGGFGVGVAQELLDDEEWGLVDSHVGADGVTDRVWGDGLGYTGGVGVLFDDIADGAGCEGLIATFSRGEDGFSGVGVGGETTSREEDVALDEAPEVR